MIIRQNTTIVFEYPQDYLQEQEWCKTKGDRWIHKSTDTLGAVYENTISYSIGQPSNSEKPNNCEDLQDWKDRMWAEAIVTEPTISKMEQVEDEQQTELVRVKYHCINCAENGSYKCSKCDGEMYYKYDKDEPQTERVHIVMYEPTNAEILARLDAKDEPQTDCPRK